jgi:hypothetical protein
MRLYREEREIADRVDGCLPYLLALVEIVRSSAGGSSLANKHRYSILSLFSKLCLAHKSWMFAVTRDEPPFV